MISLIKTKYYWLKNYYILRIFFSGRDETKILLFGFPKSGNTWLRFLIYNYRSLLLNLDIEKTISYNKLNKLQNNIMDRGTTFHPTLGFPLLYRTHKIYNSSYNLFNKKIFIHRNPLDTLISSYYFYKSRVIPFLDEPIELRSQLDNIDFYVCYKIDFWVKFYYTSIKHANFVVNYSELKGNGELILTNLLAFLEWEADSLLVKRAINFSSFNNIKNMGKLQNQKYGNGPKDGSFKGEFTRSGIDGQFKKELRQETINFVLEKFPDFKSIYPNLID